MRDKMEQWSANALSGIITALLNRVVTERFVEEERPTKRSIKEDALEAVLEGGVAIVSTIVVAVIIRRIFTERKE